MMITNGVMTDRRCYKIAGDQGCALVDQLIKSMLTIGTGFSPNDGAGRIGHPVAVTIDRFPITLHISLLEIGSKTMQVLIIRKNGFRLCAKKIGVPKSDQCH